MFKDKRTIKLFSYFSMAAIIFSVIVGIIFTWQFKNYILEVQRESMYSRANNIASTISSYNGYNQSMTGYKQYLKIIGSIAGSDVWIIDEDLNIITTGKNGNGMHCNYNDLPENAEKIIQKVFTNANVYSEDFSDYLNKTTLTLGVPILTNRDKVVGVVLLHSPVEGMEKATNQGLVILISSLSIGILLSLFLSAWLSKKFTDPIILKEALDAINSEKVQRNYVANVSHELKTPITVIRGSAEALRDKIVTDEEKVNEYYNQICIESVYLQHLVNDLLDLSRLQNDEFLIEKTKVNIVEIVEDSIRSMGSIAANKDIKLNLSNKEKLIICKGDYSRLRQMFIIIINNAIKFSDINSKIDIIVEKNKVIIKDYGKGIRAEDINHIFDRFHKARNENNKDGSGLGLAIAKQIADRHDFKISVSSKVDYGTEFIININM